MNAFLLSRIYAGSFRGLQGTFMSLPIARALPVLSR